ncbi:hypothetical protein Egran_04606, partial [Elaphomyces granulatus]
CAVLLQSFPTQVFIKSSAQYTAWDASFWSQQQAAVQPACAFQAAKAQEVAGSVLLSRLTQCPFAVKSGGHAAFTGSSNIQNGLTIDLQFLNSTTLSNDNTIARVGPGNRWVDVYSWLETHNLTAIGGRVADIGVGGLTLGGGVSFFSAAHGWACDNVQNYELVTADANILQVNLNSYPDLYWALRGGGNNFGIVTRFDLITYPQGLMWGGAVIYTIDKQSALIDAFVKFGNDVSQDTKAAIIVSFIYFSGQEISISSLEYSDPVTTYPSIFQNFKAIPAVSDTTAVQSLSQITKEFKVDNPDGLRESYWTFTCKLDADYLTFLTDLFFTEINPIKGVLGVLPVLVLQVIPTSTIKQMQKNGGNALGLNPSDGPLVLLNLAFRWASPQDDNAIYSTIGKITADAIAEAKKRGVFNQYLYMNYASQFQDVIAGYGPVNSQRLIDISQKYDPKQVFQKLQPGYFKLKGAPDPNYPS